MRRLPPALFLLLALVVASPAIGDPGARKQHVDANLSDLRDRIAQARGREQALTERIDSVNSRIQDLDRQAGDVAARLEPLEQDLALHQERLRKLNALVELQTERLTLLRRSYDLAVHRLALRVVSIYELGRADTLDVVFSSTTFGQIVDQMEFAQRIKDQDARITGEVENARDEVRVTRERTRATRGRVASVTRTIQARTEQLRTLRDSLVSQEGSLTAARDDKQQAASSLHESLKEMLDEAGSLQQSSAALAGRIQTAQSSSGGSAPSAPSSSSSSSGLIWPVSGPVTSPFGYRCLEGLCRMHEGIDIGVGYGTPIHAAASGSVIEAGLEGGYGNLTVIDHGGGIATAYGHQSRFAVSSGQHVSQGQVIGYVGCTGRCFGPHLHFEVRVNGQAVDPLGYL
jgi:murein DD-endopeptidase MepM/ murein hydrolase activator NlpD